MSKGECRMANELKDCQSVAFEVCVSSNNKVVIKSRKSYFLKVIGGLVGWMAGWRDELVLWLALRNAMFSPRSLYLSSSSAIA